MAVENSKRLDATDKEHIRRIKSTYTMKYTAMAVINAKLGCGMKEAYRLYDECNENPNNNKKMNINEFIFSRTQPQKKIDTINALTESELLSIREETVKRIVKDAGRRIWKTRDKRLRISQERRAGNAWNSSIDEVQLIKGKLQNSLFS